MARGRQLYEDGSGKRESGFHRQSPVPAAIGRTLLEFPIRRDTMEKKRRQILSAKEECCMGLKEQFDEKFDKLNPYSHYKKEDVFQPGTFNPGLFEVDMAKLKKLRPEIFQPIRFAMASNLDSKGYIQVQMNDGDIQTAVVVSTDPLLVACRSEDLDAVVLQCYPTALGQARGWRLGTRLLICCTYNGYGPIRKNKDIDLGPRANPKYKSFGPILADLYAADTAYLERKKREIPQFMWEITGEQGQAYMAAHPGMARNGLALSFRDAEPIEKIRFNPKAQLEP